MDLAFFGIGKNAALDIHPIRYKLEPKGAVVRAKYHLCDTRLGLGLGYAFTATRVTFDPPPGTLGLPDDSQRNSNVGGCVREPNDVAVLTISETIQDSVVTAPASRQRSSPARPSASGQAVTPRRGRSHG